LLEVDANIAAQVSAPQWVEESLRRSPLVVVRRGLATAWDLPWGPGGSVGFELATGRHAAKPESDLDTVLYSERRMTAEEAKSLCHRAMDLPAVVDIRVETPVCGFSLIEYARAESAPILLRTPSGHLLGDDPWSNELTLSDAAQSVGERFNAP
jgi:phosphoribosyl-dephospho-CoA transferase